VEALLQAAAQVFECHGYAAGTTNRIAERAGVSIGSLYQYFPNKDAILVELIRRHTAEGAAILAPLLAELESGPVRLEEGLRRLVSAMVELHSVAPGLHRVLFEEAPHPPALLREIRALESAGVARLEGWLARLPEVRAPDLALAARFSATVIEAVAHRLVIHADIGVDPDVYAAETVRLLTGYLSAPAGRELQPAPLAARRATSRPRRPR
jgi:AcrR family transcriptional regulator